MRVCSIRKLNQCRNRWPESSALSLVLLIIVALAFNQSIELAAAQTSPRALTTYCDPFIGASFCCRARFVLDWT